MPYSTCAISVINKSKMSIHFYKSRAAAAGGIEISCTHIDRRTTYVVTVE